jgi:hypothetical protein
VGVAFSGVVFFHRMDAFCIMVYKQFKSLGEKWNLVAVGFLVCASETLKDKRTHELQEKLPASWERTSEKEERRT